MGRCGERDETEYPHASVVVVVVVALVVFVVFIIASASVSAVAAVASVAVASAFASGRRRGHERAAAIVAGVGTARRPNDASRLRGRRDDPSSRGEVPRGDARGGRPPHGGSRAARPGDGRWRWPRGRPTRARRRRRRRRARRARHPGTPSAHPEEWPGKSDDTAEKLGRRMSGSSRVAAFEIEPFEPRTFSTRNKNVSVTRRGRVVARPRVFLTRSRTEHIPARYQARVTRTRRRTSRRPHTHGPNATLSLAETRARRGS